MNNQAIEILTHHHIGFKPLVATKKWRVAVLNYFDIVERNELYRLERHTTTDEVFILIQGKADLLLGNNQDIIQKEVEVLPMKKNIVYNIKQNFWHHVVMSEDAKIIIVEDMDVEQFSEYNNLCKDVIAKLKAQILK